MKDDGLAERVDELEQLLAYSRGAHERWFLKCADARRRIERVRVIANKMAGTGYDADKGFAEMLYGATDADG
jgi:hypothetical protein